MSGMYHEMKIVYERKAHCIYFYEFLARLSQNSMPSLHSDDLLRSLLPADQFEYFRTYLGYEWCFDEEDSPGIEELSIVDKTLSFEVVGPMSHPHERLVELLRWSAMQVGLENYFEIVENSRVGEQVYIWLEGKEWYEVSTYCNERLSAIEEHEGSMEDRFMPILDELQNQGIEVPKHQLIAIETIQYEGDGVKSFDDYQQELKQFIQEKENKKALDQGQPSEGKEEATTNRQILGKGINALFRRINKDEE